LRQEARLLVSSCSGIWDNKPGWLSQIHDHEIPLGLGGEGRIFGHFEKLRQKEPGSFVSKLRRRKLGLMRVPDFGIMKTMDNAIYRVINETNGQIVATRVTIAQDPRSRAVGLLSRDSLEPGEGLLIKPCSSIHTFFMKFPIDVIFLDKKYKILSIKRAIKPWRLSGVLQLGGSVLELMGGFLKDGTARPGDFIKLAKIL
jgi:hypothetical protein